MCCRKVRRSRRRSHHYLELRHYTLRASIDRFYRPCSHSPHRCDRSSYRRRVHNQVRRNRRRSLGRLVCHRCRWLFGRSSPRRCGFGSRCLVGKIGERRRACSLVRRSLYRSLGRLKLRHHRWLFDTSGRRIRRSCRGCHLLRHNARHRRGAEAARRLRGRHHRCGLDTKSRRGPQRGHHRRRRRSAGARVQKGDEASLVWQSSRPQRLQLLTTM